MACTPCSISLLEPMDFSSVASAGVGSALASQLLPPVRIAAHGSAPAESVEPALADARLELVVAAAVAGVGGAEKDFLRSQSTFDSLAHPGGRRSSSCPCAKQQWVPSSQYPFCVSQRLHIDVLYLLLSGMLKRVV